MYAFNCTQQSEAPLFNLIVTRFTFIGCLAPPYTTQNTLNFVQPINQTFGLQTIREFRYIYFEAYVSISIMPTTLLPTKSEVVLRVLKIGLWIVIVHIAIQLYGLCQMLGQLCNLSMQIFNYDILHTFLWYEAFSFGICPRWPRPPAIKVDETLISKRY